MTEAGPRESGEGGLQAERTALAWTRTSLALLANGAVLLLRDIRNFPGRLGMAAVGFALLVAVATFAIGRHRQRVLSRRPLPHRLTPRLAVHLLAFSVLVLVGVSLFTASR